MRTIALAGLLVSLSTGCGAEIVPDGRPADTSKVEITGAIYVEFHTDSPCRLADAPAELSGVAIQFRDPDGTQLGEGLTGPIGFQLLSFGEGKSGWAHPGCRYFAPYAAMLDRARSYRASFESPPQNMVGAGSWFTGVSDLEEQVISHEELEANGFEWDFEAEPSYVVGH